MKTENRKALDKIAGSRQVRTLRPAAEPPTPGFAIAIKEDTQLGLATLIAEFADGTYRPAGIASTLGEAREIADSNLQYLRRELAKKLSGQKLEHAVPAAYAVWAQGIDGDYCLLARLKTTE